MKMTSFSINGRAVSRLSINGREVSLRQEPIFCDALCFTAEEAGSTVRFKSVTGPALNIQTSTNGKLWTPFTMGSTIRLTNVGDKVYFKAIGSNYRTASGDWQYNQFEMTGRIAASGNVNSLLEEDEEIARTMSLAGRTSCYVRLFSGCGSLIKAPELPATILGNECYYYMFSGTGLIYAPELPAMTMTPYCYSYMFAYSRSLLEAPELPATTLADSCYQYMFDGCTNIIHVKVPFTDWSVITQGWLASVSSVGVFECPQELIDNTTIRSSNTVPPGWKMVAYDAELDALCFTAEEANSTVKLSKQGTFRRDINIQTSTDYDEWTPYTLGSDITLENVGDKVYFKAVGSNTQLATDAVNYHKFVMTGKIAASGNVNSLLNENDQTARTMSLSGRDYCYYQLFQNCTSLTQAPELPATTLANFCYNKMFYGCTSLIYAPLIIPAAGNRSCMEMFYGCTSLRTVPELPATTLDTYCYYGMFYNCQVLTYAPKLPATTLATNCYQNMFYYCYKITQAPELPATTLANSCYSSMFRECSGLTYAPALPAETLANQCYYNMFYHCYKITQAPVLPAKTLATQCYYNMFYNCTSLVKAPILPATTLVTGCYSSMFSGCSKLTYVKVAFTNWLTGATSQWLPSNAGTFECPWELITNTSTRSTSTVPDTWTMVAA